MSDVPEMSSPLLDARLRFPVHALPNERVVWCGTAAEMAWVAAMLRGLVGLLCLTFLVTLPLWGMSVAGKNCRVPLEPDSKASKYRDCTVEERTKDVEFRLELRRKAVAFGARGLGVAVLGFGMALLLRRHHLVYVVTNERVVVQDGYLGIRLDTIDLDHVVSITAKASLVEGWFGVKSVSVTVPGQKAGIWHRGVMLANSVELWGLPAQDPALSQLLNAWLPRQKA